MVHHRWNHDNVPHTFCPTMLICGYVNQAKFCSRIRLRCFQLVTAVMVENRQFPMIQKMDKSNLIFLHLNNLYIHLHLKMVAMVAVHRTYVVREAFPWHFPICERQLENQVVVLVVEYLFFFQIQKFVQ